MCDGNLIMLNKDVFTMFEIPTLHPRVPDGDPPEQVCIPLFCLLQRKTIDLARIIPAYGWRPLTSMRLDPLHFDLLCNNEEDVCELDHYIFDPKPLSSHFIIRLQTTSSPETQFNFEYVDHGRPRASWITSNSMIYLWMDGPRIMAKVASLPTLDSHVSLQRLATSLWDSVATSRIESM
jgi:hypothetical protein